MFWDDLVRRWRRQSNVPSSRALRGAAGNVAVLPAPRQQQRRRWFLLLVILIVAFLVAFGRPAAAPVGTVQPAPAASIALP